MDENGWDGRWEWTGIQSSNKLEFKKTKKEKKKFKITWNRGCSSIGLDTHTKKSIILANTLQNLKH